MKNAQVLLVFIATLALLSSTYAITRRSSHSEAPGTAGIPNADITDLYVFRSYEAGRSDYVTFLLNTYPLETPYGGPNYFSLSSDHFYEVYLDVDSDGNEDFTYQWMFGNALGPNAPHGYPYLYDNDNLCDELYNSSSLPQQSTMNMSLGISLNISGKSVPIALKVAGFIVGREGASLDNLNWEEYYSLRLVNGLLTASPNRVVLERTDFAEGEDPTKFSKPFDYAGQFSFGLKNDYEAYARQYIYDFTLNSTLMLCNSDSPGRVFVGQREDPFWISLGRIFDYLNLIPVGLPAFDSLTIADCLSNNDLREKNVATLALEVPISCMGTNGGGFLNVWAGTRLLLHNPNPGELRNHLAGAQVSRMGNPLVNELVIGLLDKDRFNRQHPRMDADPVYGFGLYVEYPTFPEIINIRYRDAVNAVLGTQIPDLAPSTPRIDLVNVFLTGVTGLNKGPGGFVGEVIRLNMNIAPVPAASQNHLGVLGSLLSDSPFSDLAGYPNGRRIGDDAVDITLMVAMGSLCAQQVPEVIRNATCAPGASYPIAGVPLRDGALINATFFYNYFPYANTPTPGSYVDGAPGNVVTDPTKCYPEGQHGRCPLAADTTCPTCPSCPKPSCPSCPTVGLQSFPHNGRFNCNLCNKFQNRKCPTRSTTGLLPLTFFQTRFNEITNTPDFNDS